MAVNKAVLAVIVVVIVAAAVGVAFFTGMFQQAAPGAGVEGVPPELAPIVEAARKEGRLVIYSTLDRPSAEPLLEAFKKKYPFIEVEYLEMNSKVIYTRYLSEKEAGAETADILWSSAANLQWILIKEGSAQPYRVSFYDDIPEYAKYKDLAYVSSFALIAPIYNKEKIPSDLAPKSQEDILKLLKERRDLFAPRSICTGDITRSGFYFLVTYYLYNNFPDVVGEVLRLAGEIGVQAHPSTGAQIERVKTGECYIATNLLVNYAFREAKTDPNLGVFVPSDFSLLVPRVMFITKEAQHPNAAKLFIEFVLSEEGQRLLGREAEVTIFPNPEYPELSLDYLTKNVKNLIVIRLGDDLLNKAIEKANVEEFTRRWKELTGLK